MYTFTSGRSLAISVWFQKRVLRANGSCFQSLSRTGMHFITIIRGRDSDTHIQKGVYAFLEKSVELV